MEVKKSAWKNDRNSYEWFINAVVLGKIDFGGLFTLTQVQRYPLFRSTCHLVKKR